MASPRNIMIAYAVPLCKQELPTAQTQRFAGKKVSLRRRQQADTPNHCSTGNKSIKILLWYAAPAMPFGLLSQVCHTACSSFAFFTAATVSFTPLRSLLPSFRFITPRSQLIHLLQGRASH